MGQAQFAVDELPHPRQTLSRGRIGGEKLLGQTHRAQRQADSLQDVLVLGKRDLATSAAQVHQEHAARHSGLGLRLGCGFGFGGGQPHHAQVNQPALLQAGDDLHIPAGLGLHPGLKGKPVAGIAHRRGGYHANLIRSMQLHRPLKALERLQRSRHRLRRDHSGFEDACSQPGHLAILVQRLQLVRHNLGNLQSAGVGTDIDGGKGGHEGRLRTMELALGTRYTTGPDHRC